MSHTFGFVLPEAREALVVVLDVTLKATALLVLAFAVHAAVGRQRALFRSALWNACLVGLLLLPVAGPAFPRLRIVVLPTHEAVTSEAARPSRNVPLPAKASIDEVLSVPSDTIVLSPAVPIRGFEITEPSPVALPVGLDAAPMRGWRLDAPGFVLGVYLLAASLLVLRLVTSLAAVGRMRRRCETVEEPAWVKGLERSRTRLGIACRVLLLKSDRVSVPVVVGWLRPAIVLPRPLAGSAGPGLVDAVLLHELAHVRRGDFGWNLVRRLVQALESP